jgi:hypothetical protein
LYLEYRSFERTEEARGTPLAKSFEEKTSFKLSSDGDAEILDIFFPANFCCCCILRLATVFLYFCMNFETLSASYTFLLGRACCSASVTDHKEQNIVRKVIKLNSVCVNETISLSSSFGKSQGHRDDATLHIRCLYIWIGEEGQGNLS